MEGCLLGLADCVWALPASVITTAAGTTSAVDAATTVTAVTAATFPGAAVVAAFDICTASTTAAAVVFAT